MCPGLCPRDSLCLEHLSHPTPHLLPSASDLANSDLFFKTQPLLPPPGSLPGLTPLSDLPQSPMLALSHNCLLFSEFPDRSGGWGWGGTSSLQVKVATGRVCGGFEDDKEARVDEGA